jgi:hypothetical protein
MLRNSKLSYGVHKSLPLLCILSQINPVQTTPSYLSEIKFIILFHVVYVFSSDLNASDSSTDSYVQSFSFRAAYPSHPPKVEHANYTWQIVQVMKFLNMQFLLLSSHFFSLRSKYSPQDAILKTLTLYPSFKVRDEISDLCKAKVELCLYTL